MRVGALTRSAGCALEQFMALTLGAGGMTQDAAGFKSELSAGTRHFCLYRNKKATQ